MKRLALMGSWKGLGIQAGLLAGLGLAFVGGQEKPAQAGGDCPTEDLCSFKKPNFMIVLDYSSSMNSDFVAGQTRWEAAVEAINNVVITDNGFFDESMHLGLIRFGHDPDPDVEGSVITILGETDMSGLVDGTSLDVGWYDAENDPSAYYECNGAAITDFLANVDPPLCVGLSCAGIGTWTYGGLSRARSYIQETRDDHPEDLTPGDERSYFVLLMTDGNWTTQTGQAPADPDTDPNNPVNVADPLFNDDDVPVYVVTFGDAIGESFADDVASAGGTNVAIEADMAGDLENALESVINDVEQSVINPQCTGGMPRLMVVLDGSSSMLNVGDVLDADEYQFGTEGMTGWDQAREALAGAVSIFDVQVPGVNSQPVEDLVQLGLLTFGSEGDQRIIVDYGPCMQDNIAWALDPDTSCGAGCPDPYVGPPIIWTEIGPGDAGYPGFDQDTQSIMPHCDQGMFDLDACTGSATATHTGLALANTNAQAYRAAPPPLYPVDPTTVFANILITDGQYAIGGWSTDGQVSAELIDMYANASTTTYVIGFGDDAALSPTELTNMACWGSGGSGIPCAGGSLDYYTAANQDELANALQDIIEQINFDPCCAFNDCSFNPEPTTGDPDPETGPGDSSSSGGGSESGTTMSLTTGPSSSDTSESGVETGVPTTGSSGDDSTTVADSDTNEPGTTGTPMTSTSPTSTNPSTSSPTTSNESESGSGSDTDTESGGAASDEGCSCSTQPTGGNGWLLGLFGLGVLGFRRRRT
jgi:MYXO-CTERM domain-containing protein